LFSPDPTTVQERTGKTFQLALVIAALTWSFSSRLLSASSARGITNRLNADWALPLLTGFFLLFLLAVGYALLEIISRRSASARDVLSLPKRPTALREWLLGAALGWGMVVIAVLPMAIVGDLRVTLWLQPRAWSLLVLNLVVIAAATLADEAIFRGYPFRLLINAIGPVTATLVMSALFALRHAIHYRAGRGAVVITFCMGIVFSVTCLRTHAVWLAWGMRFAWTASMGLLFGLPVSSIDHSAIIQTTAIGSHWFTGGDYGPEASLLMFFALLAGLIALIPATRDYAWMYTHPPIIPGGFPMDVAPPPAHAAMEQSAQAREPSLVQILPSPPQGRSAEDSTNL
jgi:membrane protease YdiL (CAAX protease family)